MEKPKLSPDFTLDDIRKLRTYNSLRHVNMTADEINEDSRQALEEFNRLMAKVKHEKQLATS
jgi:hypothetical protein